MFVDPERETVATVVSGAGSSPPPPHEMRPMVAMAAVICRSLFVIQLSRYRLGGLDLSRCIQGYRRKFASVAGGDSFLDCGVEGFGPHRFLEKGHAGARYDAS